MCKRDSSYRSSPIAKDPSHYAKFEVTSSPEEWEFVERLLPTTIIPPPPNDGDLPSGWKPQTGTHTTDWTMFLCPDCYTLYRPC